ncbi:TPA: hypothetical protein NH806_006490 [Pseudomonas aeruginosa]|nr:hypothetical protein [Pseudomonas aeruginosa]HCF0230311.1 hypothetical protein [Pseudomonas aeruginosa]
MKADERNPTRALDALLDAMDELDVCRLSDAQLDRLNQIIEALAIVVDEEYMRRDD